MTSGIEHLNNLDTSFGGTVNFEDGSKIVVRGRGSMIFKARFGENRILTDVYYIPRFMSNIISLG